MLRKVILLYGVAAVIGGLILLGRFSLVPLAIYLLVNGIVLVGAILIERQRYRPRIDPGTHRWQSTGERFIDPSSGQVVEVRYDPKTGQRDYVSHGPAGPPAPQ